MSSILKALKKLEEERSLKSGGTIDVRRAHLATPQPGVSGRWRFPLLLGGTVIVAVVATLLVVRFLGPAVPVQPLVPPPVAGTAPTSVPVTAPPAIAERPTSSPPVVVERPQSLPAEKSRPLPVQHAAPVPLTAPLAPPAVPAALPAPVPTATPQAIPPALLRVTGIAWQPEGGDRMAVVNGQAVGEGGSVAGAKVVEIMRDRVRFLRDGQQFDAPLER